MVAGRVWRVVGGGETGGIIVREGTSLSSKQLGARLATGAVVREQELIQHRLCFLRLTGEGPDTGWVSIRLGSKELLTPHEDAASLAGTALGDPELLGVVDKQKKPISAVEERRPATATMKRVWFVRHGEAEHNVLIDRGRAKEAGKLRDPPLSTLGLMQAAEVADNPVILGSAFGPPGSDARAELVVSSPMQRALQTAREACAAAMTKHSGLGNVSLPVLALPDLQECTDNPCDTGQPRSALQRAFPKVDFSELARHPDDWFVKLGSNRGEEGREALRERCKRVTAWLQARPESRIIVVAHRTLLCYLLQLDFAPAEVIEMHLRPAPGAQGSPSEISWSWHVARASDQIVPFYNNENKPLCSQGSPPLRGTLATCLSNRGAEAAWNTSLRAGLPPPDGAWPSGLPMYA